MSLPSSRSLRSPPRHRREDLARNEGFAQRGDFFFFPPGRAAPSPPTAPKAGSCIPPGASPAPRDGSSVPPAHDTRVTGTGSVPQLTQADFFPLPPLSPRPSLTPHPRARLAPIPAASGETEGFGDAGGGDTTRHTPWPSLRTPSRHRGVPPGTESSSDLPSTAQPPPPPGRGPGALGREQKVDKGSKIKGTADKGSGW